MMMSIYKQLANQFIEDIQHAKLCEGDKMPSLRQLSQQHSVSMSTAVSCYQELESQGWIQSRPQAGYFVAPRQHSHQTPELKQFVSTVSTVRNFNSVHSALRGPLGVSSTANDEQAVTELERSFRRALRRMGDRLNHYPDVQGEPLLRQALSTHFSKVGVHFSASDLVVTAGCMSALKAAIESCTETGDAIAISSPCFNGIIELLGQMARKIVEIPSLDDGIDLAQLEAHFQQGNVKAGIFCTSHMNPQGISMSAQQKQTLAHLANQYQIPVIEDDVYLELSYSDHTPLPAKYYDQAGYILWCGSVSKSLSPGYRLGWCLPGRYQSTYQGQFGASCYGVSTPVQLAVADFIDSGQYAKQLRRRKHKLLSLRKDYLDYLTAQLPEHIKISNPQGGMVLWIQAPGLDSKQLQSEIETHKIDIRLGHLFTTLDLYSDCVRINMGYPLEGRAKEELDTLIDLLITLSD